MSPWQSECHIGHGDKKSVETVILKDCLICIHKTKGLLIEI